MRPAASRPDDDAVTDRHPLRPSLGASDGTPLASSASDSTSITENAAYRGDAPSPAGGDDAATARVSAWRDDGAGDAAGTARVSAWHDDGAEDTAGDAAGNDAGDGADATTTQVSAWREDGGAATTEVHARRDGADAAPADESGIRGAGRQRSHSHGTDEDAGDDDAWLLPDGPGDDAGTDSPTEKLPSGSRVLVEERRRWLWPAVAAVLVLALVGGVFFARDLFAVLFPADFDGPGAGAVVVEVADGDSTRAIGEELVERGVVASARGFGNAAEDDPRGRSISPGFYVLREHMSAATAVDRLLDPVSRLGRVEIRSGTQLDDTAGAGAAPVPGVLSLIARATCVPGRACATADDVRRAMATTDPAQLGVPEWARADVARADPDRRLEGLLAPGTYDVPPGTSAVDALRAILRTSTSRLEAGGLLTGAGAQGVSPYQALTVASIVEREGVAPDFGKVARVIYNRLPVPMRLQMDSTINYPLDRQTLLTSPVDRERPGPYNTYVNLGLPPTPIGAVSAGALRAALKPDAGGWMYFVKCERDGTSCFAVTPAEHDANRRLAQDRGVY